MEPPSLNQYFVKANFLKTANHSGNQRELNHFIRTFTINEKLASRQHVRIELRRDKFFIVDQSTNGTHVLVDGSEEEFLGIGTDEKSEEAASNAEQKDDKSTSKKPTAKAKASESPKQAESNPSGTLQAALDLSDLKKILSVSDDNQRKQVLADEKMFCIFFWAGDSCFKEPFRNLYKRLSPAQKNMQNLS